MSNSVDQLPTVKIGSAWFGAGVAKYLESIGITTWSDAAAALAAMYTLLLIGEWVWKRVLRPFAERRGWVKRLRRRKEDMDVHA